MASLPMATVTFSIGPIKPGVSAGNRGDGALEPALKSSTEKENGKLAGWKHPELGPLYVLLTSSIIIEYSNQNNKVISL